MKKIITGLLFCFVWCMWISANSFSDLVSMAWENNSDIQNAVNSYESYIVSSENLNGAYTPSVTVASYLDGSGSFFVIQNQIPSRQELPILSHYQGEQLSRLLVHVR